MFKLLHKQRNYEENNILPDLTFENLPRKK